MKTVKLLAFALFMGSFSFAQTAAPAPIAVATPQTPSQMKWEKEAHEFGTIEQGKPVSYEFTFTNTTNKDVTLKDVKASCGCTATNYTKTAIKPRINSFSPDSPNTHIGYLFGYGHLHPSGSKL